MNGCRSLKFRWLILFSGVHRPFRRPRATGGSPQAPRAPDPAVPQSRSRHLDASHPGRPAWLLLLGFLVKIGLLGCGAPISRRSGFWALGSSASSLAADVLLLGGGLALPLLRALADPWPGRSLTPALKFIEELTASTLA